MSQPHVIRAAFEAHGAAMDAAMAEELQRLAQEAVRLMRRKAAKWRSHLVNSITPRQLGPLEWEIRPGVAYAAAVEDGVKPGKHLPRFFDPASADIVAWLESKAFAGQKSPRKGSARFTAQELALRDRYQGLSWHVKHKGVKAQPYVRPTAEEMQRVMPARVALAVRRVLAQTNQATQGGKA